MAINHPYKSFWSLLILLLLLIPFAGNAMEKLCKDAAELNHAISGANPGDTIILANKVWRDVQIEFYTEGREEAPIVLRAEEAGKVILEGESNLQLGGSYLIVEDLIFRNGYSGNDPVICFKKSTTSVANHCRVTRCVIDYFNNKERTDQNYWIAFYGKNNRLDHCYIAGKQNFGPTLTVWLGNELSAENRHRIDHNYFGRRSRLGSNGGETIRIGSSKNSMASSYSIIENNYFEHCSGETEIISIKSCDNIIQNNTFFECEGSLVLRHGNRSIVRGNIFLGNGKAYTGGIRVIGEGHLIYNNYLDGLRGADFRGPLVLMNGIPNSPLNRYFQVRDVVIAFNTWNDSGDPWFLGMGIKNELNTLPPVNTYMANNLVVASLDGNGIVPFDDISGISFINNTITNKQAGKNNSIRTPEDSEMGAFIMEQLWEEKDHWMNQWLGASSDPLKSIREPQAGANNCGPEWFQIDKLTGIVSQLVKAEPGIGTLDKLVKNLSDETVIELSSGEYTILDMLKIDKSLTIKGPKTGSKAFIKMQAGAESKTFFKIKYKGNLKLENLVFDGGAGTDHEVQYLMITADSQMVSPFTFSAQNCKFSSFATKGDEGAVLKVEKGAFADTIQFRNCELADIDRGIDLDEETDNKGIYNAEHVILYNTLFINVRDYALSYYRGGDDESTIGPHLFIDHCVFDYVNNRTGASIIELTGIQRTTIQNSIFSNSPKAKYVVELYGKYNKISHCNIYASRQIGVENGAVIGPGMLYHKPMFEKGAYSLKDYSQLQGKALDGNNIGLIE